MNLILDIIYKLFFTASILTSLYIGFYVGNLAQGSFGFPWNYMVLILMTLISHMFFVGVVLNQMIFRKYIEQNTPIFNHDDEKGSIGYSGEDAQYILWAKVVKIEILTTDRGPWEEDVWWLFHLAGVDQPIVIPQGARNHNDIFKVLNEKFENVDMDVMFSGLVSVDNALFRVWSLN